MLGLMVTIHPSNSIPRNPSGIGIPTNKYPALEDLFE
jgi:hypothetical protein